ncbi:MAG: hypothetical protein GKR89_17115 [Candidatus Latescibacteria bacterium]|nr:hypothetical protein [Candidatus Latescibacterota bacterium]
MLGRRKTNPNQEVEDYRDLLETPTEFSEGFTSRTILGVLFVAFIMIPGNMYLSLMVGGGLGAAAEWVTIILFLEILKRSFNTLTRQEVYVLYYVAAGLIAAESGAFDGLLWPQYLVQSPAAKQFGITNLIPSWWAPPATSEALVQRTFLHVDWIKPILVLVGGLIISRVIWFTTAYTLFRITSDYERLPYPFAPVAAQGATALAESSSGEETWRWRVFSAGAMIGLVFGTIYVAIPAISGALLTEPIQLIPIPFVDFTPVTGNFIPATPLGFTAHLGPIFAGFVMPFWAVMGTFIGTVVHSIANPILYNYGILEIWQPGMGSIDTFFVNSVDFWMSFGIGTTLAVAAIGLWQIFFSLKKARAEKDVQERRSLRDVPPGRGDISIKVAIMYYVAATAALIFMAWLLMPQFGQFVWFFLFFGFVFTPFQAFVNARLVGMVGQSVEIPFVREATIILSGYQGVSIWFVPFPLSNFGAQAQKFREIELTGTKFTSIIRAEVYMIPIVLGATFIYSAYIWKLAPVPSSSYPYAQLIWRLRAYQTCLWYTGTMRSQHELTPDKLESTWTPANLIEGEWWYWRARAVDPEWLETKGKHGESGPWTEKRTFFTHYSGAAPQQLPQRPPGAMENGPPEGNGPVLTVVGPPADMRVLEQPRPALTVRSGAALPEGWMFYYEVDTDPNFTAPWIQRSTDEPWLFRAINRDYILMGTAVGIVSYAILSIFGLPILLIFGYVRALTTIPHFMVTEIIGALLARYYFWNKYGQKEWRLYAPILAVGFACGMALMGMASVSVALIQKSVSVLIF